MQVICEDCGQRYTFDESQIKKEKVSLPCRKCTHIITIEKPKPEESPTASKTISEENSSPRTVAMDSPERQQDPTNSAASVSNQSDAPRPKGKGIPVIALVMTALVIGFVVVAGTFAFLYFRYIPSIINQQIELRTLAITKSFSGVVNTPMLLRNYLEINKETKRISSLPGVAYAAVINNRGITVAGFFNDLDRFESQFANKVKKTGFPLDVISQNKLSPGAEMTNARIMVGGQMIFDEAVALPDTGGKVHVGVYTSEVDTALRKAMFSPLTLSLVAVALFMGVLIFFFLTRTITKPMRELTDVANQVSLGNMSLTVTPSGPREMRELGASFERMRYSIKTAMEMLKTHQIL